VFGTQYDMAQSHTGYDNFVCKIIMLVCLKANMYVSLGDSSPLCSMYTNME